MGIVTVLFSAAPSYLSAEFLVACAPCGGEMVMATKVLVLGCEHRTILRHTNIRN